MREVLTSDTPVNKHYCMDTEPRLASPAARSLGRRIKKRRIELGLTQDQLADASGVPQGTISRVEQGQSLPTLPNLLKLRVALGLTDDEFNAWLEAVA